MKITLLGIVGLVAVAALIGYLLCEWQQESQKKKPPQPPRPNPNLPPESL